MFWRSVLVLRCLARLCRLSPPRSGRVAVVVGVLAILAVGACAHKPPGFDPRVRPTCLVLSVGGPDGVAHLGALAATRETNFPLAAVVGNSFGAVVGALYAQAPEENTRDRFESLLKAYVRETERDARRRGLAAGLLFGATAAILSEGEALPTLIAGGGGYLLGAATIDRLDHQRLVRVMERSFASARIEALALPFVTFHQRPRGEGLELVAVRSGSLAEAVGASVTNPLLFPGVRVEKGAKLDPGADRVAAVPVEDACRLFPEMNLLAINVTGNPAFHSAAMTCPVLEVHIAPPGLSPEEVLATGPAYFRAIDSGYQATIGALSAARP